MSFSPPVGSIAYGRSGIPCLVLECHPDKIALQLPDRTRIVVQPSAVVRWESCAEVGAVSKEKISSNIVHTENKSLKPASRGDFRLDDTDLKYRPSIVQPNASIVRESKYRPSIVQRENLTRKAFQEPQTILDGLDDIFTPLSGQRNFEFLRPGDRVVIKNLTACLKRHPRMSVAMQCAIYWVQQVNEDGTAIISSEYGRYQFPIDWLGVLP